MNIQTIDITPKTEILESMRKTNVSAANAFSELIDNSFDQNASFIEIKQDVADGGRVISVTDDGHGCENLSCMFRLAHHNKTLTTQMGMFGIGLKDSAISLGDTMEVESVCNGVRRTASIDWSSLSCWSIDITAHEAEGAKPGTVIRIGQCRRYFRDNSQYAGSIGFRFAPALMAGKRITIFGEDIKPWTFPALSEENSVEDCYVTEGCSFDAVWGIVESNNKKPFILSYKHRIIDDTSEPCREFNAPNLFCYVTLKGKWPLLKHKDGIKAGEEQNALHDALYELCKPIMERLHNDGQTMQLIKLSEEISDVIFKRGRGTRKGSSGQSGTVTPKGTGRTQKVFDVVNPNDDPVHAERGGHDSRPAKKFNSVDLSYCDFGEEDVTKIGRVDVNGKRATVHLNMRHPVVIMHKESQSGSDILKICALSLLSIYEAMPHDRQKQLTFHFANEPAQVRGTNLLSMWSAEAFDGKDNHNEQKGAAA